MYKLFNRNNKKGFTLIELIIVIAILAILAAILIPSMIGYINEANASVANANARSVYSAAAAAAAVCITNQIPIGTIAEGAVATVPAAKTTYKNYVDSLLGANFDGTYAVDINADAVTVDKVMWKSVDEKSSGTFPIPAPAAG